MFDRICLWRHLVLNSLLEVFLITVSISVLVIAPSFLFPLAGTFSPEELHNSQDLTYQRKCSWSSCHGAEETNPTSTNEDKSLIPGLTPWVKGSSIAISCGVSHRRGLGLVLLWLWLWPAAIAPILPLAWDLPYVMSVALKRQEKKTTQNVHKYRENFKYAWIQIYLHILSTSNTCR